MKVIFIYKSYFWLKITLKWYKCGKEFLSMYDCTVLCHKLTTGSPGVIETETAASMVAGFFFSLSLFRMPGTEAGYRQKNLARNACRNIVNTKLLAQSCI
jgi:hypothetical protein